MKHNLMKFSILTKLISGFIFVLALTSAVTIYALAQMEVLAGLTTKIYNHPLQVTRAVLSADTGIVKIHRSMKDVALSANMSELDTAIAKVDGHERSIYQQLAIVERWVLGDEGAALNAEATRLFREWKPIRDEVIHLTRARDRARAAAIAKVKGDNHVFMLNNKMEELKNYAAVKASGMRTDALSTRETVLNTTAITLLVVVFCSGAFGLLLARAITKPVQELVKGSEEFGRGNLDYRVNVTTGDELGRLAAAFNVMAVERQRAEGQARLQSEIVENMAEGVVLVRTRDGVIVYTNPTFDHMFGYDPGALSGKHITIINAPSEMTPQEAANEIIKVLSKAGVWHGEVKNIKRDRTTFWCRAHVSTFEHPQYGEVWVSVHEDVTERKRAEQAQLEAKQEAEAASQAKSVFLANMSHELRTPLNAIMGYAQILQKRKQVDDEHRRGLEIVYRSGGHLLTLINDILDLSKIEASKMDLLPTDVHVQSFLDDVAGIVRARAVKKSLEFAVETVGLPKGIRVDEVRLRQVLLNLLSNSVKFTEQGGVTLRVGVNRFGDEERSDASLTTNIRFEIEDTGIGISPDDLDRIFLPFEQVGGIKERAAGTGLGLGITKELVIMMGGELHVDSTPGQGSRFWVDLSFPIVEAEDKVRQLDRRVAGYAGPRRRILVADDDVRSRGMLHDMLNPLGFEVVMAEDGRQALDSSLETRPDLILMDLVMPVMGGIEAAQAIRRESVLKCIPIIVVSASELKTDQDQGQMVDCNAFLSKPFDEGALYALLKTYLNLTWTFAEPNTMPDNTTQGTLVPPPPEELTVLHEMALAGVMSDIEERAAHIATLGEPYRPFAESLRRLAENFADEEVLALVEQYVRKEDAG